MALFRWSRQKTGHGVRILVDLPMALARIVPGWMSYLATGKTSSRAYGAMRELFCLTDGRFNDSISATLRVLRPPYLLDRTNGVLGDANGTNLARCIDSLARDGLHVFDARLSEVACREIEDFALRTPCYARRGDTLSAPELFEASTARDARFDFRPEDLGNCDAIRRLLVDHSLLAVAQAYLGSRPVIDVPAMWWSTPGTGEANSDAAQLYHFDMDRLRFLKFFFLITDVTADTGPHCYVRGSHRRKPLHLLSDGRKSDEEIFSYYGDRCLQVVGPRGTIFAADTRGFHKGLLLQRGVRLLFQIEFANSLFGQNYPRIPIRSGIDPEFESAMDRYPFTYSHFDRVSPRAS